MLDEQPPAGARDDHHGYVKGAVAVVPDPAGRGCVGRACERDDPPGPVGVMDGLEQRGGGGVGAAVALLAGVEQQAEERQRLLLLVEIDGPFLGE